MDDRVKAIIQREAGELCPPHSLPLPKPGWTAALCRLYFSAAGAGLMKRYQPQGSVLRPGHSGR